MARFLRLALLAPGMAVLALLPSAQAQEELPPVMAADAKEFEAARALYNQKNWDRAMRAFEAFRFKYKDLSPMSLEAQYLLGLVYLQKATYDDAVREFRQLMAHAGTKDHPALREEVQLRIAGALALKGVKLPSGTTVQKVAQNKAFEDAIAEYDKFLALYRKSRNLDIVNFNRGSLLLSIGQYDDAVGAFEKVAGIVSSPLRWAAHLYIAKARMVQAGTLLGVKDGKEPKADEVKQALNIMATQALPALQAAYSESRDLAVMNEAVFAIGQVRLAQQQNAPAGEDPEKLEGYLSSAVDAFRVVRGREEVLQAQQAKIGAIKKMIGLLDSSRVEEYASASAYYEALINVEETTNQRLTDEQDPLLGARLAIARIFLLQKRHDECRVLVRQMQAQKPMLAKEKETAAELASLLALSYVGQGNGEEGLEAWKAFRKEFKGDAAGEAIPLALAHLWGTKGGVDNLAKAREVIREARADYTPWRFEKLAEQLLEVQ